ncbi:MAG: glycosyltransferase family 4 protein [Anaerolineae bacterium]|nr:glycosyltransferase family 4 protein [Anaerolineae bacterium]
MKILHLVHRYHPSIGGSQYLFKRLSEGLVAQFHDDVTVFTTNSEGSFREKPLKLITLDDEVINGVRVKRFPFSRRWTSVLDAARRISRKARLPLTDYLEILYRGPIAFDMFKAMVEFKADVIAGTPFYGFHMLFPYIAQQMGYPVPPVVYWGALHITGDYIRQPALKAIHSAAAYVANTEFEREVLIKKGVPQEKIHVIGVGVDTKQFTGVGGHKVREMYNLGDGPVVGFIGRQARGKGIDTLIQAMYLVWKRQPEIRLLIAGARTDYSHDLHQLVGELPASLRDNVVFVDSFAENEKPQLFAACDVFVSVSRIESFGIVYLEAWASGKPVIGSRVGAVQNVIHEEDDGLLVAHCNVPELAAAISRLLNDTSLRLKLARNGKTKVQSEYDWEIVTRKLHHVYDQIR